MSYWKYLPILFTLSCTTTPASNQPIRGSEVDRGNEGLEKVSGRNVKVKHRGCEPVDPAARKSDPQVTVGVGKTIGERGVQGVVDYDCNPGGRR